MNPKNFVNWLSVISKPWVKLGNVAFGFLLALIYMEIDQPSGREADLISRFVRKIRGNVNMNKYLSLISTILLLMTLYFQGFLYLFTTNPFNLP